MSIYKTNPILENEKFLLRLTENKDCDDLLKVYSDKNALPFLIVIIVMVIIFIMLPKKECRRRWIFGICHIKTVGCYRETRDKVNRRKEQGAVCVEMECAGMQALCDFRGTEFFRFFYAGDSLDYSSWDLRVYQVA